ncbi:MAG: FMN-binding glutamate synthase family protein, partial [Saprospiraceae bacterium]|nr:FMN-binding glutamate synthase family protein [Saprospiraceae bacterium]
MRNEFIAFSLLSILLIACIGWFVWSPVWWSFVVLGPLILVGFYDIFQKKHAIMRNFPVLGRGRYIMEELRPKMYQYFIESDTSGRPINRINRSIVYQRAKHELDTTPFGTQLDVYEQGYEWLNHSITADLPSALELNPRITVGGLECSQPYSSSLLNISAMSFGSLSKNAILALNGGAKMGGFAHNTGEGGISPYHLKYGGDLIFQFGTGYFG